MIYDYEIKQKNNEEVLYLYLNFNQEFAKLNAKVKKKKLNKIIEEYINSHKIIFNGTKVAIIVGGLVIGTLTFNQPNRINNSNTYNLENYTISSLIKSDELPSSNVEKKEEVSEEKNEKEVVSNATHSNATNTKKSNTSPAINNAKEEVVLEPVENKTYVTIYRTNSTVLNIELEEYVIGVVAAEMPALFHSEALKAQAILARTYALKSLASGSRLTDNSSTQNYKSNDELKSIWGSSYNTYYQKIKNAVLETKGMYLTYKGEIIDAVYHSTSNGKTEDAKNVWGKSEPYLVSVASPFDNTNSAFLKDVTLSYETISTKLNMAINLDTNFEILSKTEGNRVLNIQIDSKIYTGVELRNLLGLRSADFEIEQTLNGIKFTTKGYGHGVGMSQYGANGMAKNGSNYTSILKHYYTGVTLSYM